MVRSRGHIVDRGNGAYRLVINGPPDPLTGRRRQITKTIHTTGPRPRQQAQQQLTKFLAEVDAGRHDRGTSVRTFGHLYLQWLDHASASMEPNTADEFQGIYRRYLATTIGPIPLAKLRAYDLDRLYGKLAKTGSRTGGPLSSATVKKVHTAVRLALKQGTKWKWITENPAVHATPPKVAKSEPSPPTPDEARRFIDAALLLDPDWSCYLRVAAALGARRGELCALRWSALDLEAGEVSIRASVIVVDHRPETREYPKTAAGRRHIGIDLGTVAALRAHRRRQAEAALAAGVGLVADGFVFAAELDGSRPWHPVVVTHRFARLRNRVGLPAVRLHDLRHAVATQLLGAGVDPVTVAGRLGHANPHVTMKVYAHWIPARDQAAATLMGDILDGRS